ncbi:hypothetical protein P152DRAFT_381592, partial [Eremomyces bilateralis CBS 781.70]
MFWGAIVYEYDLYGTGPCHTWSPETIEETRKLKENIDQENVEKERLMEQD